MAAPHGWSPCRSPWLLPACLRVNMHDVFALPPLDGLLQFRAILNKVARTL